MPPPSSENDLKRRARRRLIGAVALTLLAVTVLPLLLEDEPPPASSLAVHMAVAPELDQAALPNPAGPPDAVAAPALPASHQPAMQAESAGPAPNPRPEPLKSEPVKPPPKPQASKPVVSPAPPAKPEAASAAFVVQLAALSDAAKAQDLKARAAKLGFPAFTDKVGHLTRVRVGPYPSREAAVAAAVKLAENKMAGQVIAK
jgi:DedD protein